MKIIICKLNVCIEWKISKINDSHTTTTKFIQLYDLYTLVFQNYCVLLWMNMVKQAKTIKSKF